MNKKVTKKEEVDLIFVKIIHNIGSLPTIYIGMDCRTITMLFTYWSTIFTRFIGLLYRLTQALFTY